MSSDGFPLNAKGQSLRFRIFIVLVFLSALPVLAMDTLVYRNQTDFKNIGEYLYHVDPEDGTISKGTSAVFNLGYSTVSHTFRFAAKNESNAPLLLFFANPLVDTLVLYKETAQGELFLGSSGDKLDYSHRTFPGQNPVLDLKLLPGETSVFRITASSEEQMLVPVRIGTRTDIIDFNFGNDLFFYLYLMVMAVMLLYNSFIYYTTRDRSYLFYVLYIFGIALAQAGLKGYLLRFFPSLGGWYLHFANAVFSTIAGLSAIAFAKEFLQLKERAPRFNKGMYVFIGIYALVVPTFFISPFISYNLLDAGAVFVALYALVFSVFLSWKGYRTARFFLFAWIFFMAGLVIYALKNQGILAYNIFTDNGLVLGSAIETVFISLALADRINILKREKEESQAEALEVAEENRRIIAEQNVMLEQKVTERTRELVETNQVLDRAIRELKSTQAQLVNAEKMASLGQLTAGVAHEINNPINFVSSNIRPLSRDIEDLIAIIEAYKEIDETQFTAQKSKVEELMKRLDYTYLREEISQLLKGMEEGASRTVEIVKGLKNFSRLDEAEKKLANINEGIESTLILLNSSMRGKIQVEKHLGELPMIECYPGKLNQVFMNLMNNAIYAIQQKFDMEPGGVLCIESTIVNGEVIIRIKDNGTGMPEATLNKIFDPFYTTKPVGDGTGLGLSIVYSIIESHQGHIAVSSVLGEGTTFTIQLPQLLGVNSISA